MRPLYIYIYIAITGVQSREHMEAGWWACHPSVKQCTAQRISGKGKNVGHAGLKGSSTINNWWYLWSIVVMCWLLMFPGDSCDERAVLEFCQWWCHPPPNGFSTIVNNWAGSAVAREWHHREQRTTGSKPHHRSLRSISESGRCSSMAPTYTWSVMESLPFYI